ncbi:MAG: 3-phosphoglycerate dehydrogenase [Oscillospiraceae bacterium]|jgi:D-3-phosphoglycerate dehydrogenase|nr:3-phosphoglycerate dehydrogenase [Oscillospiraceae bacterium]
MYKIKTMNSIAAAGTDLFNRAKYSVSPDEPSPDALLIRSAKLHDLVFNDNLLCIARSGVGTNNIPEERCTEAGIVVFNTPGANADAVKELVLCSLLLSSRDILGGIDWVRTLEGSGDEIPALVEAGKNRFVGPELLGKSLGVIGLGAVGAKIANDAARLGMNVYGYDPYISVDVAWGLRTNVRKASDYGEIYRSSDYITIHTPYITEGKTPTHHLINGSAISQMKDGVRIINLSRGEIVNDDDMLKALASGKVSKYVTDFPNSKLVGVPNVIAIPHLGASTPESEEKCAYMAAAQIIDYLENGNIINSVNMPRVAIPRSGTEPRVCVMHKNIPDMIARISGAVGGRGINIENMVNAAVRGSDMAYTLLDVSRVENGLRDSVTALDGVLRVRILT